HTDYSRSLANWPRQKAKGPPGRGYQGKGYSQGPMPATGVPGKYNAATQGPGSQRPMFQAPKEDRQHITGILDAVKDDALTAHSPQCHPLDCRSLARSFNHALGTNLL